MNETENDLDCRVKSAKSAENAKNTKNAKDTFVNIEIELLVFWIESSILLLDFLFFSFDNNFAFSFDFFEDFDCLNTDKMFKNTRFLNISKSKF